MKKYLLLLILLLIPFFVNAEENTKTFSFVKQYETYSLFPFMKGYLNKNNTYLYAEDYTYQDGVYILSNPVSRNLANTSTRFYYTCGSTTESSCETLYAIYADYTPLINQARTAYPAFILEDGHTEGDYYYFQTSDRYTKEGNQYVLDNPTNSITLLLSRKNSNVLDGKMFCLNLSDRCDELYFIHNHFEGNLFLSKISDDFIYGNGFDFQDGKYILKDIVPSKWPEFSEYIGTYSCMNQETSCDTLYKITNYKWASYSADFAWLEMYSPDEIEGVAVKSTIKDVSLMKSDTYNVQTYIQDASDIWIEDESILKIENGKIVPLKKGTTTILFKKDQEVYLLHVEIDDITKNDVNNPKTSHNTFFLVIVMIGVLFGIIKIHKSYVK